MPSGQGSPDPEPPVGCWKTFRYQRNRGVYLCPGGLVWFQTIDGEQRRLAQSLEAFRLHGAPEGAISKTKLRRLWELLNSQPTSNPMQPLIDILSATVAKQDLRTVPDCANCGHVSTLVSYECPQEDARDPIECPSLALICSGRHGATSALMKCATCGTYFLRWYSGCGEDFPPTGKELGTAVTLKRVSVLEAVQYLERGW